MTKDEWHDRINEISDICNTTIILESMTKDEIVTVFYDTLSKIYALAVYPPDEK